MQGGNRHPCELWSPHLSQPLHFSLCLQVLLLALVFLLGRVLEYKHVLWFGEAGAALMAGILAGGLVRAARAGHGFLEALTFNVSARNCAIFCNIDPSHGFHTFACHIHPHHFFSMRGLQPYCVLSLNRLCIPQSSSPYACVCTCYCTRLGLTCNAIAPAVQHILLWHPAFHRL